MFPYEITAADMQYAQELLQRARSKAEGIFNNSKPYHAAVVMENIFRETREAPREGVIRIYGKNLNGEISGFDNYRYQLTSFLLAPNTRIKVIIDEVPHTKSKSVTNAYQMLSAFSKSKKVGGKISMKKVIAPVQSLISRPKFICNFTHSYFFRLLTLRLASCPCLVSLPFLKCLWVSVLRSMY